MKPDLIIHRPDIETVIKVPQRRYWFAIYDEAGRRIDIRPYLLGSSVRAGMLIRYARWLLISLGAARYAEITADTPEGAPRPLLAIVWTANDVSSAATDWMPRLQSHITQEGLGLA